jgi:chaperonin GroES
MNIKLLQDRVIIESSKEEVKTAGGFTVTKDTQPNSLQVGTIVVVGEGKMNDKGELLPMGVKVGDKVMFNYGTGVKIDGKSYLLVNESDVVLVLN